MEVFLIEAQQCRVRFPFPLTFLADAELPILIVEKCCLEQWEGAFPGRCKSVCG